MPNLRLSDSDVDKLLGYMDQESRRIAAVRAGEDPHQHHAGHGGDSTHGEHADHGTPPAGS